MINNRQAGRRRGRGGQQQRSQGGNPGRGQDTGNRIDNRSRGNAAQLLEKYKALARDSQMQGDRVNTEYYLQFADHYFRVLAETRSRFEENRTPAPGGANSFQDDENEYDDDGEPIIRAEQSRGNESNRGEGNRDGNRPDNRNENRGNGNSNGGGQSNGHQQNGQYDDERPRGRQNGNGGNGNGSSEDRYARDEPRENSRDNGRGARPDRNDRQGYARDDENRAPARAENPRVESPRAETARDDAAPVADRPRRGRPRRDVQAEEPIGFEADRLPPSLNISAVSDKAVDTVEDTGGDVAEEKPRRRRVRAAASETPPSA